jgi:two-component system, chemotaxis family, protein-glutamate methylesterase/glutaminase
MKPEPSSRTASASQSKSDGDQKTGLALRPRAGRKIRVLIVDDSAVARRAIRDALAQDPEIEVVDVACDAYVAREKILKLDPDVITLDLEMPRMDGLTFLRILNEHHPLPVVVVSSLTPQGSAKALEALAAGAIDVLAKPSGSQTLGEVAHQLAYHVKAAARARLRPRRPETSVAAPPPLLEPVAPGEFSARRIILIGASTGGVEALRFLLPRLPDGLPPIAVVQHIPPNFSRLMAERLNELCPFEVREAVEGDELRRGLCLVAPGDFHLALVRYGGGYRARLTQSPPVHHCRPSVDVLFRSAAEHAGAQAVAALLTGMGSDGARGLQALRATGARTLAEHEDSCVVYGMPQAAIKLGVVDQVATLDQMPQAILQALAQPVRA